MRPTISELITGVNRTLMSVALPKVMATRDMDAVWELSVANRLISFIESRWKNEFGRLAGENMAMEGIIGEAVSALKPLDHPLASDLQETLERSHIEVSDLPGVDTLYEANVDLKGGLDKFIIAHTELGDKGSPELTSVRANIRGFLKKITARDFEAAQNILYF